VTRTAIPFGSPLYVMLKPVGSRCNLACRYCYYLDKERHEEMSDELLEAFIRQYLEVQTQPEVLFTWHGGEPLLRPVSFYQKALQMQQRYAHGRTVDNCLQTNGTLLTDEWCSFLHDNRFLVGISIDGPQNLHDAYRQSSRHQSTWQQVMNAIELLNKYDVMWNAMATVNHLTADEPQRFYRFFRGIGCQFLQFTPVVERIHGEITDYSVSPDQWGRFLCGVYDEWVLQDIGQLYVQLFDATLANWVGESPGLCSMSPLCGRCAAMESNGDVYSCDHFVFPEYLLGNIRTSTLTSMLYGERQQQFGRNKQALLSRQCRECPFLFACHGECPRNRFVSDCYGESHHNYLCDGYRQYFEHVAQDMDFMKSELEAGRAPANLMLFKGKSRKK
jgi:uncharacterized protein